MIAMAVKEIPQDKLMGCNLRFKLLAYTVIRNHRHLGPEPVVQIKRSPVSHDRIVLAGETNQVIDLKPVIRHPLPMHQGQAFAERSHFSVCDRRSSNPRNDQLGFSHTFDTGDPQTARSHDPRSPERVSKQLQTFRLPDQCIGKRGGIVFDKFRHWPIINAGSASAPILGFDRPVMENKADIQSRTGWPDAFIQ